MKRLNDGYIFLILLVGDPLTPGSDMAGFRRRMADTDGASTRIRKESTSAVNVLDATLFMPFASMYQCVSVNAMRATAPGKTLL